MTKNEAMRIYFKSLGFKFSNPRMNFSSLKKLELQHEKHDILFHTVKISDFLKKPYEQNVFDKILVNLFSIHPIHKY